MSDQIEGDVSILEILTQLIQRWKLIAICTVIGGGVAAVSVVSRPPLFRAYASFASQPTDQGRAGLASLAGQFGIAMPGTGQAASPEYYAKLITSRALLLAVARDSFQVPGDRAGEGTVAAVVGTQRSRLSSSIGTSTSHPPWYSGDIGLASDWHHRGLGDNAMEESFVGHCRCRGSQRQSLQSREPSGASGGRASICRGPPSAGDSRASNDGRPNAGAPARQSSV